MNTVKDISQKIILGLTIFCITVVGIAWALMDDSTDAIVVHESKNNNNDEAVQTKTVQPKRKRPSKRETIAGLYSLGNFNKTPTKKPFKKKSTKKNIINTDTYHEEK